MEAARQLIAAACTDLLIKLLVTVKRGWHLLQWISAVDQLTC